MRVMCSNHASAAFVQMVQNHPTKLGWLYGPSSYKTPRANIPFALDNDAYSDWKAGRDFNYLAWIKFLDKIRATGMTPLWMAVPDVVADRSRTLKAWIRYKPVAECYNWPLAFVVQDGMKPTDVPYSAAIVFVGGTTSWKWRTVPMWAKEFPRVHVGRCGTSRWKLDRLEELGVESCDGSGFFRATSNGREARQLFGWVEKTDHQLSLT